MSDNPPSAPTRRSRALKRRLVEAMVEAELAPAELAERLGIPLDRLSALALDESMLHTLRGLARVADVRAQMLLSKYRANAAAHLIAIASVDEPSELARKACVDLLHANLDVFEHPPSPATRDASPSAPGEQAILRALEELGPLDAGGSQS